MARALGILVVFLMLGLSGPTVSMAAPPVGLDVVISFDETGRPDYVTVDWEPVDGAVRYQVVWGPKKEPGRRYAVDPKGKTKDFVKVNPGEATNIMVVAYDEHGKEIARSKVDVVEIPKGKSVGGGQLETHGIFDQAMPTGSDHQDTKGWVQFQIYVDPSLGKGKFRIYGRGNAKFKETTVTTSGTVHTKASAPVIVTGVLRYPTDEEEETSDLCRMDLTITEAYKGQVADCTGTVHGIPVHDFLMDWDIVKKAKAFPLIKNHQVTLASDVAHDTYTLKLTDIEVEAKTGCAPK